MAARAADIHVNAGEWIVHEGDPAYFWVVLSGEVEATKFVGGAEEQITTFDPDEFFGEVPLMLTAATFSGVRALRPSRLARIDAVDFHAMVTESPEAGAILAQTMVRRVNIIRDRFTSARLTRATIVGDRYDFLCHDIRDFLARNQIPYEWLDPSDPGDAGCIPQAGAGAETPYVLLADGRVLESPTTRALAEALDLHTCPSAKDYEVIIIGGWPGGSGRGRVRRFGRPAHHADRARSARGQAGTSSRIENYLGFPGGVSGGDLAARALQQAERFGTEILVTRSVEGIETTPQGHLIRLDGGDTVLTRAVVIATGVSWRKLDARGCRRADRTRSVLRCGPHRGTGHARQDIFLIGGGNSAGQAAMFFSSYASR